MAIIHQSRRNFLISITALAAAFWGIGRYLAPISVKRKVILTVQKSKIPGNGALVFKESGIAIINSGEELYALSLVCTHLGCIVNVTTDGLQCPCHGSRFDRKGNVLEGPADRPLARYHLEENDGVLTVFA